MKQLTKHEKREMVEAILDDFDFDLVFKAIENVELSYKPSIIQLVRDANKLLYGVIDYAEVCKAKGIYTAGEIVHHKIHLTPQNISNPDVSLAWDNLQLLCRECHAEAHTQSERRYSVDELGRVSPRC